MALFRTAEDHAANPPETWEVVKVAERLWALKIGGVTAEAHPTKRRAEELLTSGFYVNLYEKERRWYAGERVAGWRPYSEFAQ